jgi:very-short-patch-repair endonuclease
MSICVTHPQVVTQWHPTKNGNLKPEDYTFGSDKKVWWICPNTCSHGCIHEWLTAIKCRCRTKSGCPYCCSPIKQMCEHMSILYTYPDVAKEWHPTKNGNLKVTDVTSGCGKKVWWLCTKKCSFGCLHEYESIVAGRCSQNTGCSYCIPNPMKICEHMSIKHTHPELSKYWHPTKNLKVKVTDVTAGSDIKVWWLCPNKCTHGCFHEWQTSIYHFLNDSKCPFCSNRKLCEHMSIEYTHPEIAREWHPTKNKISIKTISFGSNVKIWWLCSNKCKYGCLHEYISQPYCRINGEQNCPYCAIPKKQFCKHESIEYTHPNLINDWDFTKNKRKPSEFTFGTHQKVYWRCLTNKDHSYLQSITSRTTRGTGCTICKNKTEMQLNDFLQPRFSDLIHSFKQNWCVHKRFLPFDFCIPSINIIIELDGIQHFKKVSNWTNLDEVLKRDIYKMHKAEEAGYKVIRIFQEDVYKYDEDWLEKYLLPEIQSENRNHAFIAVKPGLYEEHMRVYAEDEIGLISDSESEKSEEDLIIQL